MRIMVDSDPPAKVAGEGAQYVSHRDSDALYQVFASTFLDLELELALANKRTSNGRKFKAMRVCRHNMSCQPKGKHVLDREAYVSHSISHSDLGSRFWDLGFRIQDSGFRIWVNRLYI